MTHRNALPGPVGSSDRMTQQIKALASTETATRDSATKALLETLVREGETLPPAAAALAVLEPMVAAPAPGAHRAAWVLGEVFAAGCLARLQGQTPAASPERDAVMARAEACRTALRSALASEDAAWRSGAAFALAFVPGVDPTSLASAARGERDSHARTSLVLALGFRARAEEDARRALTRLDAEGGGARGIALARALAGEPVSGPELSRDLIDFCLAPPHQEAQPWGGLVGGAVCFVEALVPSPRDRQALAPDLAEALVSPPRVRTDPRRPQLAKRVLAWSDIGRDHPPKHVARVEELTPDARRIAVAFATDDSLSVAETVLPGNARALRRWLGQLPPGPLEAARADGQPRWVSARALIAAGKPFSEVLEAATDGLTARAKLDALTELLRGAYRILWDARGRISPEALAEEAARAGDEAVAWAKDIVHEVVALPQGIRDFRALSGFASGHLMVALAILVRAGEPLEAGVEREVSLPDPAAREILAALPADAVRRATLERWRTQALSNTAGRHLFVDEVMPLFDVVGSPELAREMLADLGGAGAKPPPGIAPAIMETLARIVGDG
jgi:hypothetical protein